MGTGGSTALWPPESALQITALLGADNRIATSDGHHCADGFRGIRHFIKVIKEQSVEPEPSSLTTAYG